ncbi:MAG: crossover junction endodeoxyribonuclease RuvC [Pseudomonadota bacterium]
MVAEATARAGVRILGIDPGLRRTGWGVIEHAGARLSYIASGLATSDAALDLAQRLTQLHDELQEVVRFYTPDEASVEETFVNKNPRSTLKLGQARGIALLVPSLHRVPVHEYAPNLVKKTVIGSGHGDKAQIRAMLGYLLPKAKPGSEDEADALAIAICHAHCRTSPVLASRARGAAESEAQGHKSKAVA